MMRYIGADCTIFLMQFENMVDESVIADARVKRPLHSPKEQTFIHHYACFDDDIDESVITASAKQKPYYFVMRDSGMANDSLATNFEQIFETFSRDTVRRVL